MEYIDPVSGPPGKLNGRKKFDGLWFVSIILRFLKTSSLFAARIHLTRTQPPSCCSWYLPTNNNIPLVFVPTLSPDLCPEPI
jgi:hypothetical protein